MSHLHPLPPSRQLTAGEPVRAYRPVSTGRHQELIGRLCHLQEEVANVLGHDSSHDCLCGEGGFWHLDPAEYNAEMGFRNEGEAVDFIVTATRAALEAYKDIVEGRPRPIASIALNGTVEEMTARAWATGVDMTTRAPRAFIQRLQELARTMLVPRIAAQLIPSEVTAWSARYLDLLRKEVLSPAVLEVMMPDLQRERAAGARRAVDQFRAEQAAAEPEA